MSNRVGSPIKLDKPEIREKYLSAARLDANITACCAYAGITRQTYHNYIKEHPEFIDEIDKARQEPYLKAVNTVVKNLDDPKIAINYLERRHRKEFATRQEMTGGDGEPYGIEVTFVDKADEAKTDSAN